MTLVDRERRILLGRALAVAAALSLAWAGPVLAAEEDADADADAADDGGGGSPQIAAASAKPSFFNSKEILSRNMKPFKKWTSALARYSKEVASEKAGSCADKTMNKCHYEEWIAFLDGIKGKEKLDQIKAINDYVNKAKYITDQANWGQKDYWATPYEFMAKFGDCEDYAIAKFMSLRTLGFSNNSMRVVAVKDLNLKVGHAVLVVFQDGKVLLLDNQIKQLVDASTVKHYLPVFSINEKFWWRHRM